MTSLRVGKLYTVKSFGAFYFYISHVALAIVIQFTCKVNCIEVMNANRL